MLLKIIPLILLLLTLPDIYIYYMYIHRLTTRIWFRLIWFMPSLILAVAAATIISSNDMTPQHQPLVSTFMIFFLCYIRTRKLYFGRFSNYSDSQITYNHYFSDTE